jgi:cytochrome c oxidase assembly protein subunit 15
VSTTTPAVPVAPTTPAAGSPWVPRLAWANLAAQIGIIVTGGAVRLTGSGLGCSTWPQCEPGQFTPVLHEEMSAHTVIEFGNRTLTGVLGVIAVALLVAVWRDPDRPRWYRRLAVLPIAGVAAQAVIGGITVLADLHPAVVGLHMVVSLALVAGSTALVALGGRTLARRAVTARTLLAARALLVVGGVLMVLGTVTTGAGPHGGDDEVPYRYAVDPVLAAKVHAGAVWAFVLLLLACLWLLRRDGTLHRAWWVLLAVTAAQGLVGYVQYFTGLPEVLVGVHLLGTGLLTTALAWAWCRLRWS